MEWAVFAIHTIKLTKLIYELRHLSCACATNRNRKYLSLDTLQRNWPHFVLNAVGSIFVRFVSYQCIEIGKCRRKNVSIVWVVILIRVTRQFALMFWFIPHSHKRYHLNSIPDYGKQQKINPLFWFDVYILSFFSSNVLPLRVLLFLFFFLSFHQ